LSEKICYSCFIDEIIDFVETNFVNNRGKIVKKIWEFGNTEYTTHDGNAFSLSDKTGEKRRIIQNKLDELINFIPICDDVNDVLDKLERLKLTSDFLRNREWEEQAKHSFLRGKEGR